MKVDNTIKLDFSDVLIRPKRSLLSSRNDVDVCRTFKFKYSQRCTFFEPRGYIRI